MSEILHNIWAGVTGASWIEQAATVLGLLGVWLTIRQSLWNFPVGLVQVTLSGVVFYQAKLYADMKLQVFFFAVLAYGWWHWARGEDGKEKVDGSRNALRVTRLSPLGLAAWIGAALAGAGLWGWYLRANTDAAMPFRDAFIASFSIAAQWLQARKKLENWAAWMVVNASAVAVYWLAELHWFAVLYALFFVLAVGGHFEWRKAEREAIA